MKVNYGNESNCAFGDPTLPHWFSEVLLKTSPFCHVLMHIQPFVKPSIFLRKGESLRSTFFTRTLLNSLVPQGDSCASRVRAAADDPEYVAIRSSSALPLFCMEKQR